MYMAREAAMNPYTYMYIYMYIYLCFCMCMMHICMYMYIHICIYTCMYVYIYMAGKAEMNAYTNTYLYMYVYINIYICMQWIYTQTYICTYHRWWYGVATISRLIQLIGLFCKRALWKRLNSAKETYNFKEPTNRSHPITVNEAAIIAHKDLRVYINVRINVHMYVYKYVYIYMYIPVHGFTCTYRWWCHHPTALR